MRNPHTKNVRAVIHGSGRFRQKSVVTNELIPSRSVCVRRVGNSRPAHMRPICGHPNM